MSTALALTPSAPIVEATRRSRIREVVETWRRQEAPGLPIAAFENLIDRLMASDATAKAETKPLLQQVQDATSDLDDAIRHIHVAEHTLEALRKTLLNQ